MRYEAHIIASPKVGGHGGEWKRAVGNEETSPLLLLCLSTLPFAADHHGTNRSTADIGIRGRTTNKWQTAQSRRARTCRHVILERSSDCKRPSNKATVSPTRFQDLEEPFVEETEHAAGHRRRRRDYCIIMSWKFRLKSMDSMS